MKYLNFKLLTFILTALLAFDVGWAGTVTFDLSTAATTNGTKITSLAQDGVTLTFVKGSGNDAAWYSGTVRIYQGGTLEVNSPNHKITGIVFIGGNVASDTNKGGLGKFTASSGTYTVTKTTAPNEASWSGSINYVEFSVPSTSSAQVWLAQIVVTTEDGGDSGKTDVDLAFSSSTATATLGQSFTAPILSVDPAAASSAVAYSSSNTSVATVASNGTVTPVAAGTTTITASISNNATYNDASASYELTVEAGSQPGGVEYELLTNLNQLQNGKKVIIANSKASGSQKAMGPQASNNFSETDVTITSGLTITAPSADVQILTLEGQTDAWYFKTSDNEYLYAASSSSNHLKTQSPATNNAKAKIELGSDGISVITFQGNYTHNLLRYNSGSKLFSCYASGQQPVYLYVESGGSATERVATPTFSPAEGAYDEPQSVTISCETPNSTIYYTTDGSTPDETSTMYTGGTITVRETTTIKAIAVASGMDNSYVASATYNIRATVDNFADAYGLDDNTNFKYTKDVVVVYRKNGQMWIQDKDGSEGGGFVFTEGLTFSQSDVINANWTAKKIKYSLIPQHYNLTLFISS